MTASPLHGRRSPTARVVCASDMPDWRLHLIAGYLPPLIAVAASKLGRRVSARTS